MILSMATLCLSGSLDRKLEVIAEAGFDGVEIFENDLLGFDGSSSDVGRLLVDLGLRCVCYQPFRDFEGLPPALRSRALARAEAKFELLRDLGTDLLLVCSSVHPAASGDVERIVDDFRLLAERAARLDVRIGYEALAWGRFVRDYRQAWDVVRRVAHPAFGLVLDSFHGLARRSPLRALETVDPSRIFLIQIADAPRMRMDFLYWSRHFRCLPFQGDLPVDRFVASAARAGYAGPLSLEIFNDRFRETSAARIARDGRRAIDLLCERAGLVAVRADAVKVRGIEFVEFTVSPAEAVALGAVLNALGFARVGAHRTKEVSLWRQGGVYFVLNCDPNGWARRHWEAHGASVCAIALRVDSVSAALDRARHFGAQTFEERPAEGELEIPWIRGVGDSLTYFIETGDGERSWIDDFLPLDRHAGGEGHPPRIERIDHLAQAMHIEEFLSWQLHYTALYDVVKARPIEISDALGLVQSQALATRDGAFRVTLNGSNSRRTLSGRFVEQESGAGVQHVALETADIFSVAAYVRATGLQTLPISANYYDDLGARTALPATEIARMRADNILYDHDEHGEYFQLYTRAFDRRFFFEIVERRGYQGYGASNAGIRLAAQSRYRGQAMD